MALSQFSLNEQNIIRAFLLQEGRLPTQSELNAAFTKTNAASGLEEAGLDIPASQEQSNTNFALAMYAAVGQDNPDSMGLQYWADAAQQNRAQALIDFQFAAQADIESTFETELAAIDATLTPTNTEFDDGDDVIIDPVDTVTTYVFNTTAANPYDDDQDGDTSVDPDSGVVDTGAPLTDAEKEAGASEKESYNHYIFNIGKDALDQGKSVATSSYTFELSNQAGSVKEYEGYFMSPLFFATGGTGDGSVATINIYDHFAVANDESETLTNSRTDVISFRLNGDKYAIVRNDAQAQDQSADTKTVVIEDLGTANTYAALVDAINDGIAALNNLDGVDINVTAALGASTGTTDQRDASNNPTGASVVYRPIELTASEGELTNPLASGTTPGNQTGNGYNAFYSLDVIGGTLGVISTNLELDNVGYLSQGGSINLAGQSQSDRGVEEFNVTTENGVWLTELRSNPLRADIDYLETINLSGSGYFKVGKQVDGGSFNVENSANAGLVDVKTFNAANFTGEIQLDADLTEDLVARDLNLRDDQDAPAGDNVTYSYALGSNNDRLLLDIDGGLVEHEDAVVNVNLGAGNDYAHVEMTFTGNELANQQDLDNVTITAGAGNDTIWTEGAGTVVINGDAGNDVIYTDNSGANGIAGDAAAATWVVNASNNDLAILDGNPVAMGSGTAGIPAVLYGATLTVVFSGANAGGGVTAGNADSTNALAAIFENGFESTVDIPTNGVFGDQRHVNQAIKEAINDDAVLSKLLVAMDGPDNTVIVRSLIDGLFVADDLEIRVEAATATDFTTTETAAIVSAVQEVTTDSTYDGTAPTIQTLLDGSATQANAVSGMGVDSAVIAQTVAGTDIGDTTAGVAGVAEVFEVQTFDVSAVTVANGETLTFTIDGNAGFVYTNGTGGALTGAALATDIAANIVNPGAVNGSTYGFTTNAANLIVTQATAGQPIADITAVNQTPANGTIGAPAPNVDGVAPVSGTETFDFTGISLADGESINFVVDGNTYTYTNTTGAAEADAVLAGKVAGVNAVLTNAAAVVTYTQAAGSEAPIAARGDIINGTITSNAGTQSTASNDGNVITAGAGDDVVVLSTEGNSGESLVFAGNFGNDTVVNFTDAGAGADTLDFSAYLTALQQGAGSTSTTSQDLFAVNGVNNNLAAGSTTLVGNTVVTLNDWADATVGTVVQNWEGLTSSTFFSAVTTADSYGNLSTADFTLNDVADAVNGVVKSVVMIENDANDGEYKVFEVTADVSADGNANAITAATLVGTIDFGETLTANTLTLG